MKFQMPGGAAAASRSRQVPGAAATATGPASSRALGSQVSTTAAAARTAARTSGTSAGTQASLFVVSHRQLGLTRRLVQRRAAVAAARTSAGGLETTPLVFIGVGGSLVWTSQ